MSREAERRRISSFGRAFALSAILNVLLVATKELYPPFKESMAALSGHHWITHGLAFLLVFFLAAWALPASARPAKFLWRELSLWGALGSAGLILFYLLH